MPGVNAFDKNVQQYEQWFLDHPVAYLSEVHAIRELVPMNGAGIEIGIGTGRFAAPLGIQKGIEPSSAMAEAARKKGLEVLPGVAENLPFRDEEFDHVLMVTTVCFLDDMDQAFSEVHRVLRPDGLFVAGFIDRESPLGRQYLQRKDKSVFYKDAVFYSVPEIVEHMRQAGFDQFDFRQTLFTPLDEMKSPDPVQPGHGRGSFVVVRGVKSSKGQHESSQKPPDHVSTQRRIS
jgi:SAM-dependent methyltransferase